LKLESAVCK